MLISEKMKKNDYIMDSIFPCSCYFPQALTIWYLGRLFLDLEQKTPFLIIYIFFGFLGSGFIIYTWLCACILFLGFPHQFNTLIKLFLGFDACLILLGFNILPGKKQDFRIFLWHDRLDGRIMNHVDEVLILNPQFIKTVPL